MSQLSSYFGDISSSQISRGRNSYGLNRAQMQALWNQGRKVGKTLKGQVDKWRGKRASKMDASRARSASKATRSGASFRPSRGAQRSVAGGDSASSYTRIYKAKPFARNLEKILGKNTIVGNSGARQASSAGKQSSFLLCTLFDVADVISIFTNSGLNAGPTYKMTLDTAYATNLITNQENSNCRMTIYDIMARRDVHTAGYLEPNTAFLNGFADASGGTAAQALVPGITPYSNSRFCEMYKIVQTTDVILAPGATHNHTIRYNPHKLMSNEIDTELVSGSIGKFTFYSLVIFSGTPINDSVTKTVVSLSPINLDVVQMKEYKASYLHAGNVANTITNSLPLTFAVGAEVMNDDGLVQADVAA